MFKICLVMFSSFLYTNSQAKPTPMSLRKCQTFLGICWRTFQPFVTHSVSSLDMCCYCLTAPVMQKTHVRGILVWFFFFHFLEVFFGKAKVMTNTHDRLVFFNQVISSVQSLSPVQLFATPRNAACQASVSVTNSQSLLKLMSIESVMTPNPLIFCHPLLLLPSIFPRIRVFVQWVNSWHQVAKILELQLQHQSFQWIFRTDFL